jgi:ATP-binding cassette subfamily B protein
MGDIWYGATRVLASSWRAGPGRLLLSAFLMTLGTVSAPLMAVFLGRTVDATIRGDAGEAVLSGVAVAAAALFSLTMEHFAHIFFFELADLHQLRVECELGVLAQGTVGLERHERREHADRMELLREQTWDLGAGVQTMLTAITLGLQIALSTVLLARLEPWLLLLPLFALPPLVAGRLATQRLTRAELASAEPRRLRWHLLEVALSRAAAKEIRLFGMRDLLRRRYAAARQAEDNPVYRANLYGMVLRLVGQLIFAAGYLGSVLLIVRAAVVGHHTVGAVVMVITLAAQTNAQAAGAVAVAGDLQRNARAMSWLRWLRDESGRDTGRAGADLDAPQRLRQGIRLTEVGFRYPGADVDVLRGVTLDIPAGTTVAVVGENGAGKSTLVKLLSCFYRPTVGTITVDGTDLSRIDPARWRARLAAGFQDYLKLETSALTASPTASTRISARATTTAPNSPAASGSAWHWAGR